MSRPIKSRPGSLDDTIAYTPKSARATDNWPTADDWLKVIAIALLAAILTNTAITATAFFQQAKDFASNVIYSPPATVSDGASDDFPMNTPP